MRRQIMILIVICVSVLLASCGDTAIDKNTELNSQVNSESTTEEVVGTEREDRTLPDGTPVSTLSESQGLQYKLMGGRYYVTGRGVCKDNIIVIPKEHEGLAVTAIMDDAFSDDKELEGVVLSENLTHIGENSFSGTRIKYIVFSDVIKRIGSGAFANCKDLESISIPEGLEVIESRAFYNCESLTAVTIPDSLCEIERIAFKNCYKLEAIDISKISAIGEGAFYGCGSLKEITISDVITVIPEEAFYGCNSLESITMGDGVVELGYQCFRGCASLKDFELPSNLKIIGQSALYSCGMTTIILPEGIENIGSHAFENSHKLERVIFPEYFSAEWAYGWFEDCPNLKEIELPEGIIAIDCLFSGCTNLEKVMFPSTLKEIYDRTFSECSSITEICIPEGVEFIGSGAFENCRSLTTLTIPKSVTEFGQCMLMGCTSLEKVIYGGSLDEWNSLKTGIYFDHNSGDYTVYCSDGNFEKTN